MARRTLMPPARALVALAIFAACLRTGERLHMPHPSDRKEHQT
jgi:hypothetical protein